MTLKVQESKQYSGKGRSKMSGITFVGGGSFGTALSVMLSKNGHDIVIWDRKQATIDDINIKRENEKYLPKIEIPSKVRAVNDLEKAISCSKYIVLSVPSHVIREISSKISPFLKKNQIIVNLAKGIEERSKKRLSEVIKEEIPENPIAILSGPSHAEEIALDIPTTLVVSAINMEYAKEVQDVFMTGTLRIYTNSDIIGIEIGGAVKNIIALAAGICDGIGYGDNTKAALMTRGMSEMVKIGTALGGNPHTFYGLTGMGDLIVTCTSMYSRNRRAGILIGKGMSKEKACSEIGMVVEGVKACEAFYELSRSEGIVMPITEALYNVLFSGKNPENEVKALMLRDKKSEI